jgi:hypothetical protein
MKFHTYIDRLTYKEYPRFMWRDENRFIIFLWGINMAGGDIEPVFISLIRFEVGVIETPWLLIHHSRRWPFIILQRSEGIRLED